MSRESTNQPSRTESERSPLLPSLDPGLHLVDVDDRADGAVQSLAVDHILTSGQTGATATWVDSNGVATTSSLARLIPSRRLLERIHVARAFTPYQHHELVTSLPGMVGDDTSFAVVPEFEFHYRNPDIRFSVAHDLIETGIETLRGLARDRAIPILVTRETTAPLSAPLVEAADSILECELTRFGPRFVGDEFETLVYPVEGGFQTTLSYWAEILSTRFDAVQEGTTPSSPTVTTSIVSDSAGAHTREVATDGTY